MGEGQGSEGGPRRDSDLTGVPNWGGGEHSHFHLMPLCPTDDSGSDTSWGVQETVMLLRGSDLRVPERADVQVPTAQSQGPPSCLPGDKEPRTQAKQSFSS